MDTDDDSLDDHFLEEESYTWNDSCQYIDGAQEIIWETKSGSVTVYTGEKSKEPIFLEGITIFRRRLRSFSDIPEINWIANILKGIRILGKISPRTSSRRSPSFLQVSRITRTYRRVTFGLADSLARRMLRRIERGELEELEGICQRIGLGKRITVKKFLPSENQEEEIKEENYVSSVLLDGVNIGLLSDGTLRVLSILIEIIFSPLNATTIIEEPELQIHPGMLSRLLREIESYTFGESLIISTHSPQVVSWTTPDKINLVYRERGSTFLRRLQNEEVQDVVEFLCEEGNLGDWIYSGAFDD